MLRNRRIQVLHYSGSLVRGGAEEHLLTLLRGFDRRHLELHLACPPALMALLAADLPADVHCLELRLSPRGLSAAARFCRYLRRQRIQIVHSHLFFASRIASPLAHWLGVRTVETPHVRESWRRGWKRWYGPDRLLGRAVDAYIAVSRSNAEYLIHEKKLPAHKVRVVRNGVSLDRFLALPDAAELRRDCAYAPGDCVVLAAARLEPQKGHDVLLAALARLRDVCPRLRLVCAGDGSCLPALRAQAERLQLAGSVNWVGFQNPIEPWLAMADIFVLPSRYEGLPLAAMEAMAARLPVVASAVDGTREIIQHGHNGLLVPAGDPVALAEALLCLYRDPALRDRLGRQAREWALLHAGDHNQIRQTEHIYFQLCHARRPGQTMPEMISEDAEISSSGLAAITACQGGRLA